MGSSSSRRNKHSDRTTMLSSCRRFFGHCRESKDGLRAISNFKFNVQFKLGGRPVFWARASRKNINFIRGTSSKCDLIFDTDIETYHAIFEGRISLTDAWFSGKLKLPGFGSKRTQYARLLSTMRICQGHYFWKS